MTLPVTIGFTMIMAVLVIFTKCANGEVGSNAHTIVEVTGMDAKVLRGARAGDTLQVSPYAVKLSNEWMVIEKSPLREDGSGGELLHCRMPEPQTLKEIELREQNYVRHTEARMQADIWDMLLGSYSSENGCLYGNGGGPLTGVSEWYLVCLQGEIRKVNKTAIASSYGITMNGESNHTEELRHRIEALLRRVPENMEVLEGCSYLIGAYNSHATRPQWNPKRRSWEMIYESNRACNEWRESFSPPLEDIGVSDTWTTVLRLHCDPLHQKSQVGHWSVTKIRQTCMHEVLLAMPQLCKWERGMDNLRVNPILCIPV